MAWGLEREEQLGWRRDECGKGGDRRKDVYIFKYIHIWMKYKWHHHKMEKTEGERDALSSSRRDGLKVIIGTDNYDLH